MIEHFGSWNAAKRAAGLVPRASRHATSSSGCSAIWGRSSAAHRPRATSTSTRAGCLRSRSTGTPSARSRMRCAKPASTSPSGRSGSNARSSRDALARKLGRLPKFADWAEARKTGRRRSSPSGRSTGCSTRGAAPGRPSSSLSASALVEKGVPVATDGRLGEEERAYAASAASARGRRRPPAARERPGA